MWKQEARGMGHGDHERPQGFSTARYGPPLSVEAPEIWLPPCLCVLRSLPLNPPGSCTHRDMDRPFVIHSLIRSHVKSHQIHTSMRGCQVSGFQSRCLVLPGPPAHLCSALVPSATCICYHLVPFLVIPLCQVQSPCQINR